MKPNEQTSRRLLQAVLVSLNGVVEEPLTWAGPYFHDGSAARSLEILRRCDALLMGRGTYEIFSRQWPAASGPYAEHINAMRKYVFSNTLEHAGWNNTSVVPGDPAKAVTGLKRTPGQDLMVYGHGRFGQTLVDAGLVDELSLTVVPVFVDGATFHRPGTPSRSWELVSAGPGADPGLVSLRYRPSPTE
ncbi:dihydrofolate reductase family protein [Streptomyces brasiliensis]|uniref:Pyrimidine reductase n=1 Tax=Streptomyces brasiliensis TaxID=1954 RepID=A0A917KU70_9ACTN|nr:dihydrofolate reductase family protein [Streptomyces brasiliensis]GGJ27218.1 pyrimidine reductase [Streptomyces brasiliensis]